MVPGIKLCWTTYSAVQCKCLNLGTISLVLGQLVFTFSICSSPLFTQMLTKYSLHCLWSSLEKYSLNCVIHIHLCSLYSCLCVVSSFHVPLPRKSIAKSMVGQSFIALCQYPIHGGEVSPTPGRQVLLSQWQFS